MPKTLVDLRQYVGQWIAQEADGDVIAAAPTFAELLDELSKRGVDPRDVAITEVIDDATTMFL